MRIKKDTILKTYLLASTSHLTNEEFGILIRNVMLNDDKNGYRYENLDGMFLELYKQKETEWINNFNELIISNPAIMSVYNLVFGQVSNSRNAFDKMQDRYDERDGKGEEQTEDTTQQTEEIEQCEELKEKVYKLKTFAGNEIEITAKYSECVVEMPSETELQNIINEERYTDKRIKEMFVYLNMCEWINWKTEIETFKEENKLPFDI